ncbi:MAG: SAM-dependent methyltransferase, partial [Solirubrobacterales bacterium]
MSRLDALLASGRVPDPALRAGARAQSRLRLLRERRLAGRQGDPLGAAALRRSRGPIAVATEEAHHPHYAVAPGFFELVLGPRLKYSCCLYESPATTLAQAEEAMLALATGRAGVQDGMEVLDLGCGWGSMSLWLLEQFPGVRVTAVSNSAAQRGFIEERAQEGGLAERLEVVTADVNELELERRFDRVVSIEMFEHARNWKALLEKVERHLEPGGELFVHTFAHRELAWEFESGWMADRFFTGGQMPAAGLMARIDSPLAVREQWWVDGTHYARTAADWLVRLDDRRAEVLEALRPTRCPRPARRTPRRRLRRSASPRAPVVPGDRTWGAAPREPRRAGRRAWPASRPRCGRSGFRRPTTAPSRPAVSRSGPSGRR